VGLLAWALPFGLVGLPSAGGDRDFTLTDDRVSDRPFRSAHPSMLSGDLGTVTKKRLDTIIKLSRVHR